MGDLRNDKALIFGGNKGQIYPNFCVLFGNLPWLLQLALFEVGQNAAAHADTGGQTHLHPAFVQNHAVFRQFLSKFWAQGPLGSKLRWAPLTKILDPPESNGKCCREGRIAKEISEFFMIAFPLNWKLPKNLAAGHPVNVTSPKPMTVCIDSVSLLQYEIDDSPCSSPFFLAKELF